MASESERAMAFVAQRFSSLGQRIVFVGGAVLSLLIDDPASTPVRPTDDVDIIVDVSSRERYHALEATPLGLYEAGRSARLGLSRRDANPRERGAGLSMQLRDH